MCAQLDKEVMQKRSKKEEDHLLSWILEQRSPSKVKTLTFECYYLVDSME
jgi:hypothetical protein